jgi:hypothetical protein
MDRVQFKLNLFKQLMFITAWSKRGNFVFAFGTNDKMTSPSSWYFVFISSSSKQGSKIKLKLNENLISEPLSLVMTIS